MSKSDNMQADAELRAEIAGDKRMSLSGTTYVSAMLREDVDKYPWRDNLCRLPASTPDKCHHGITICSDWSCLSSWAIDWRLYLNRTVAGRRLADEAGWNSLADIPADKGNVPNPKEN